MRGLRLVVYVRRKVRDRSRVAAPVPRRIRFPKLGRVATDVVSLGHVGLHLLTGFLRPAEMGCSISRNDGVAGSAGCLVRPVASPTGPALLLTCAHVLTDTFRRPVPAPPNATLEQPARVHQIPGGLSPIIGVPLRCHPVVFTSDITSFPNEIDAGVAQLLPNVALPAIHETPGICPLGAAATAPHDTVWKVGWATGRTAGAVRDTAFRLRIDFPDPANPGFTRQAGFFNLVLAEYKSGKGDSGALVLNAAHQAVGLHIAGPDNSTSSNFGVYCRIQRITALLGLALV
jgi:hypothetical protein